MPAYGKQLSPAEVEALVSFLGTLGAVKESADKPTETTAGR